MLPSVASAATVSPTTTLDQYNTDPGQCSLQEAVETSGGSDFGGCTHRCLLRGDPAQSRDLQADDRRRRRRERRRRPQLLHDPSGRGAAGRAGRDRRQRHQADLPLLRRADDGWGRPHRRPRRDARSDDRRQRQGDLLLERRGLDDQGRRGVRQPGPTRSAAASPRTERSPLRNVTVSDNITTDLASGGVEAEQSLLSLDHVTITDKSQPPRQPVSSRSWPGPALLGGDHQHPQLGDRGQHRRAHGARRRGIVRHDPRSPSSRPAATCWAMPAGAPSPRCRATPSARRRSEPADRQRRFHTRTPSGRQPRARARGSDLPGRRPARLPRPFPAAGSCDSGAYERFECSGVPLDSPRPFAGYPGPAVSPIHQPRRSGSARRRRPRSGPPERRRKRSAARSGRRIRRTPPRYSPKTSRIALQTSPIRAARAQRLLDRRQAGSPRPRRPCAGRPAGRRRLPIPPRLELGEALELAALGLGIDLQDLDVVDHVGLVLVDADDDDHGRCGSARGRRPPTPRFRAA